MPIWLRRVTYGHLLSFKQKEAEARSGNTKDEKLDNASSERLKEILREKAQSMGNGPDYTAKARK